jgi:uncharacterized protein (TIGR02646 family)
VIRIASRALPLDLQRMLDQHQAKIDALPGYAARVEAAARAWDSPRRRERFEPIVRTLEEMCSGEDRCMYCEDSAAREIDHHRPKSLFPEQTFVWENYVFACGGCNGPKGGRFGGISARGRQFVELKRERGVPVTAPDATTTLMLIDPRREDPLRYMILDLAFPFHFRPRTRRCALAQARAAYTIEVLGLNKREKLIVRRGYAYQDYVARLREYASEADPARRERIKSRILRMDHPTVFREMIRQHAAIPELRALFAEAREALEW